MTFIARKFSLLIILGGVSISLKQGLRDATIETIKNFVEREVWEAPFNHGAICETTIEMSPDISELENTSQVCRGPINLVSEGEKSRGDHGHPLRPIEAFRIPTETLEANWYA